jgi:multiple sugar transport system substrate-binding protein
MENYGEVKRMKKRVTLLLLAAMMAIGTVACNKVDNGQSPGTEGKKQDSGEKQVKTTEISIYRYAMSIDAEFDYIVQLAKQKFPNYTLKGIMPTQDQSMDKLILSGNVPDIIVSRENVEWKKLGLLIDLGDLIKKHQYDISKLEPVTIDMMRIFTGGYIAGIPLSNVVYAMHYNKDLFDRFGVAYPKDGITWDEVYELARKMTASNDNVVYRGYSERWMDMFFALQPFSVSYLDPNEDKAAINNDIYRKVAANWKRFYELPGLQFDAKSINKEEDRKVFTTGGSAMTVITGGNPSDWKFAWDLVSTPTYADLKGIEAPAGARYMYITKSSANKEAAFELAAWLSSEEIQKKLAADMGLYPIVTSKEVKQAYRLNDPAYKGKNIAAFSYNKFSKPAPARKPGLVEVNASNPFAKHLEKVILEGKDLNSAFRDAEEEINQLIRAEKAK